MESLRNRFPLLWDMRLSKSAMKKRLYLQVPPEITRLAPPQGPLRVQAASPARDSSPTPPPMRDSRKFVRRFPAFNAYAYIANASPSLDVGSAMKADATAGVGASKARAACAWWEGPIVVGALLIALPPVGLSIVWSSRHYDSDARWALTGMTALMMGLATVICVVFAII
jgi:hypothetical protein